MATTPAIWWPDLIAFLSGEHAADVPTRRVAPMLSKPGFQRHFPARVGLAGRLKLSSERLDGRHSKRMKANFMSFSSLQPQINNRIFGSSNLEQL